MKRRMQLRYDQELTVCVGSGEVQEYTVRVQKVEPTRIWVSLPVALPRKSEVRIRATRQDVDPAANCRFEARVAVAAHDPRVPGRVAFEAPETWVRVQERDFARMSVILPVKWRLVGGDGAPQSPWRFGETVNLSGGGLSLKFPAGFLVAPPYVELQISLKDDTIVAHAQVIRGIEGKNDQRNENEQESAVALNFTRIHEADRDRIVRYIFELQADMRRKGLA